jgi:pyruvate/2-oxoglutarate dehydrogenase complex dihydrolipoamide acyltransferase (E2) component
MAEEQQTAQEVAATTAAKARAQALGLDLSTIGGTGKGGTVTVGDIESAIAARPELVGGGLQATAEAAVLQDAAPGSVLAFGCPNCEVATFIGEKRHLLTGGPLIPRDVRCPVCGTNMILREPFQMPAMAGAELPAEEAPAPA